MARMRQLSLIGILTLVVACGERDITMTELRTTGTGPEEFGIVPAKPLQAPETYTNLPQPTPGGANRADLTPREDAVDQLGGRGARISDAGPVPASDGAIVTHASRFGVPSDIRETLAAEDEAFRRRQSRFTKIRLFRVDRYGQAYKRMALNPFQEQAKFRRAGVLTPTAPPQ